MDWKYFIRAACREIDINPLVSLFVVLWAIFFVMMPLIYIIVRLIMFGSWYLVFPLGFAVALVYLLISWIIYKAHDV